jgi:membrane fusion protein (multidrug efflux system)
MKVLLKSIHFFSQICWVYKTENTKNNCMNNFSSLLGKVVVLLSIAFLAFSCGSKEQKAPPPPELPVVEVIKKNVPLSQDFVAQIYGQVDIPIRARVVGFLEGIHFDEGRPVDKGQLLYTIDSQPYEAEVARQLSRLAEAKTEYTRSQSDLNRIKPLAEIDAVSKSDLDAAQAEYDAALAYVDAMEASVELARIELGYCYIKAPTSGLIGKTQAKVGEFVGQEPNPVILNTVSKIGDVRVEFFLTETAYLRLAQEAGQRPTKDTATVNQTTTLQLLLSDGTTHPYPGKVDFINREVDQQTGSLLIQASFPNPEKLLRPGQFARVRITINTAQGAMLLPQKCFTELQGLYSVTAVNADNVIVIRQVEVGAVYKDYRIVTSGVETGDKVLLEGLQKVRPGMTISPQMTTYQSQYSTEIKKY